MKTLGPISLILVLIGAGASVGPLLMGASVQLGLAFVTPAICLVGSVLGWCSFKTRTGFAAAVVGTLLVIFYGFCIVRALNL
jgi:hypothetical protein